MEKISEIVQRFFFLHFSVFSHLYDFYIRKDLELYLDGQEKNKIITRYSPVNDAYLTIYKIDVIVQLKNYLDFSI